MTRRRRDPLASIPAVTFSDADKTDPADLSKIPAVWPVPPASEEGSESESDSSKVDASALLEWAQRHHLDEHAHEVPPPGPALHCACCGLELDVVDIDDRINRVEVFDGYCRNCDPYPCRSCDVDDDGKFRAEQTPLGKGRRV